MTSIEIQESYLNKKGVGYFNPSVHPHPLNLAPLCKKKKKKKKKFEKFMALFYPRYKRYSIL